MKIICIYVALLFTSQLWAQSHKSAIELQSIVMNIETRGLIKREEYIVGSRNWGPFRLNMSDGRYLLLSCQQNDKHIEKTNGSKPTFFVSIEDPGSSNHPYIGYHFASAQACQNLQVFLLQAEEKKKSPECSFLLSGHNSGRKKSMLILAETEKTFLSKYLGIIGNRLDRMINGHSVYVPITTGSIDKVSCDGQIIYEDASIQNHASRDNITNRKIIQDSI